MIEALLNEDLCEGKSANNCFDLDTKHIGLLLLDKYLLIKKDNNNFYNIIYMI